MDDRLMKRRNRIYLQWHLTKKCTNRCRYCYQDVYTGEDVKLEDARTIIKDFFYHFVNNPKMEKYREIYKIEGCRNCNLLKYCWGCRAAAYIVTGNDFKHDPQCPMHHSIDSI